MLNIMVRRRKGILALGAFMYYCWNFNEEKPFLAKPFSREL
jgi:hypothetical protein